MWSLGNAHGIRVPLEGLRQGYVTVELGSLGRRVRGKPLLTAEGTRSVSPSRLVSRAQKRQDQGTRTNGFGQSFLE